MMTNISITEAFLNIATTTIAIIIPHSDKFLRKASLAIIHMVGIVPNQESLECQSERIKRSPKIRRKLRIHRQNIENTVISSSRTLFASKSYQNFLHYHKRKYMWYKSKYSSMKNKKTMFTIQESDEF